MTTASYMAAILTMTSLGSRSCALSDMAMRARVSSSTLVDAVEPPPPPLALVRSRLFERMRLRDGVSARTADAAPCLTSVHTCSSRERPRLLDRPRDGVAFAVRAREPPGVSLYVELDRGWAREAGAAVASRGYVVGRFVAEAPLRVVGHSTWVVWLCEGARHHRARRERPDAAPNAALAPIDDRGRRLRLRLCGRGCADGDGVLLLSGDRRRLPLGERGHLASRGGCVVVPGHTRYYVRSTHLVDPRVGALSSTVAHRTKFVACRRIRIVGTGFVCRRYVVFPGKRCLS